ncbi:MAG: hypothetical protein VX641_07465 [Planctomycetota bacterium]|nr:hypothetical protein [Planctomycetota bacterium]
MDECREGVSSVSNIHSSIATLAISICRVGALLALLQMAAWVGGFAELSNEPSPDRAPPPVAGISYLQSVGEPQLGAVVGITSPPIESARSSIVSVLGLVREVTRALLWMLVLILIPLGLLIGVSAPFVGQVDSYRMMFGTVALLGLLPLARAESIPMPWVAGGPPYLPESLLAGGAVPLVTAILLGSAAVLFDSRRLVDSDPRTTLGPAASLSSSDVQAIIQRGEPCRIRSSRLRRTMP